MVGGTLQRRKFMLKTQLRDTENVYVVLLFYDMKDAFFLKFVHESMHYVSRFF